MRSRPPTPTRLSQPKSIVENVLQWGYRRNYFNNARQDIRKRFAAKINGERGSFFTSNSIYRDWYSSLTPAQKNDVQSVLDRPTTPVAATDPRLSGLHSTTTSIAGPPVDGMFGGLDSLFHPAARYYDYEPYEMGSAASAA